MGVWISNYCLQRKLSSKHHRKLFSAVAGASVFGSDAFIALLYIRRNTDLLISAPFSVICALLPRPQVSSYQSWTLTMEEASVIIEWLDVQLIVFETITGYQIKLGA